jgi:hypothetical protein
MAKIDNESAERALQHVNGNDFVDLDMDEVRQAQAKRSLDEDYNLELEEVLPQPIQVSFVEHREADILDEEGKPLLDEEGNPQKTLKAWTRIATINSHVPVEFMTEVAALKRKLEKLQQKNGQVSEDNMEEVIAIYAECVLKVWQLTEPKMTLKRLRKGLKFKQIRGLFARFFRNLND